MYIAMVSQMASEITSPMPGVATRRDDEADTAPHFLKTR
jgi:hypothetical protein